MARVRNLRKRGLDRAQPTAKRERPDEKPSREKRMRTFTLSEEDAAAWAELGATVKPIAPAPARVPPRPAVNRPLFPATLNGIARDTPHIDADVASRLFSPVHPSATLPSFRPSVATPAPPPIDARAARHVVRGTRDVDARFDLHGLRHDEARHALRGFLFSARNAGARMVLVITGKGTAPSRDAPFDFGHGPAERGVLKRAIQQWLREPDLAAIVVGTRPASPRHGGSGALYIQLKRRT